MEQLEKKYDEFDVIGFEFDKVYNREANEDQKVFKEKMVMFNEARIFLPVPAKLEPTARKTVRITEREALHNNSHAMMRKKWYVLAKEKKEIDPELQRARDLYFETFGKKPNALMKTEKLIEKINEDKNKSNGQI